MEKVLVNCNCTFSSITDPQIVNYQWNKSFDAEIIAIAKVKKHQYSICLDFRYSRGTKATDKNTLYNIDFEVD